MADGGEEAERGRLRAQLTEMKFGGVPLRTKTPVHYAAQCGQVEALRLLLGADEVAAAKDAQDQDGATPAHVAARYGHVGALQLLLGPEVEATKEAEDQYGRTPVHYAAQCGQVEALHALKSIGALVEEDSFELANLVSASDQEFARLQALSDEERKTEQARMTMFSGSCWEDPNTTFFVERCAPGPIVGSGYNKHGNFAVSGNWGEGNDVKIALTNQHGTIAMSLQWDLNGKTLTGTAMDNVGEVTFRVGSGQTGEAAPAADMDCS
eukprot:COSAG05_NODE_698_length_7869_cov_639.155727_5_plen_267_part_00